MLIVPISSIEVDFNFNKIPPKLVIKSLDLSISNLNTYCLKIIINHLSFELKYLTF